jgi:oxygen-dependent protoporphyrinogen oxidase
VPDTLIIGGGISGLSCAMTLHAAGADMLVLEAAEEPGGKIRTETHDGFRLECGPNTVQDDVPEAHDLVAAAGLTDEWIASRPENHDRFIWKTGRRHRLPSPPFSILKALTTPMMSPLGKLRFACEPFVARGDNSAESLRSFGDRRLGPDATRSLLEPFASGVHAADPDRLEIESAFPKLAEAERRFGNLLPGMFKLARERRGGGSRRSPLMRSFADGLQTLPATIAARLAGQYRGGCRVQSVARDGESFVVHYTGPQGNVETSCRNLVLATPPRIAGDLLMVLDDAADLAGELRAIASTGVVVVHVGAAEKDLTAPLDGFGHLAVRDHGVRTLGTIYASSLYPGRCSSPGQVLLTSFTGGALDPAVIDMDDDAILQFVLADLSRTVGFRGEPVMTRINRWPEAFPQYHIGHAARQRRITENLVGIPGLHIIGNYLNGVSINDCIRSGMAVGRRLISEA